MKGLNTFIEKYVGSYITYSDWCVGFFLVEDCERNDGSAEKPYFMSKNLMKILGKKNKLDWEPKKKIHKGQ